MDIAKAAKYFPNFITVYITMPNTIKNTINNTIITPIFVSPQGSQELFLLL